MKKIILLLVMLLALATAAVAADMVRYIDADGVAWWTNGGAWKEVSTGNVYKWISEDAKEIHLGYFESGNLTTLKGN